MNEHPRLRALRAAFPHTIPVLAGYLFLGIAYGVYMRVSGMNYIYSFLISLLVFGGSLQYVMVTLLTAPFAPITTFFMAFMIQARHIFYSIAMLDKYRTIEKGRPYLIFGLTDETFSITCSADAPEGVDQRLFMLFVTVLDQCYWVTGATLGGILGSFITFNTTGLDFVMTAMFVVIFLNQWLKEEKHYTALIGLGSALVCLLIFGQNSFLIPTMAAMLILLTAFRKPIEKAGGLTL